MPHIIDSIIVEGIGKIDALSLDLTSTTTASGTQTLTASSTHQQVYTGSTAGQLIKAPDATTLSVGHQYRLWNSATVSVAFQNNTPTTQFSLAATNRAVVTLTDNSTAAGVWIWTIESNASDLKTKAGQVSAGTFAGSPKTATVTFTTAFPDANYSVTVLGQGDGRSWRSQSKVAGSFVINTQANTALSAAVDWIAVYQGEN